jgi:hypothetical protein
MSLIKVQWGNPFQIDGIPCCAAEHDGGWLVASTASPRFCFWGKTQEEAEGVAERGIKYWLSVVMPGEPTLHRD